jgi:hypothetical protein
MLGVHQSNPYALSAEVYAHEMGHADLAYASPKLNGSGDCPTAEGCSGAIHEGQADYHAAILFGPGPIGESVTNKMSGIDDWGQQSGCFVSRTIEKNVNLTAEKAFDPCSTLGGTSPSPSPSPGASQTGEVHDGGALYASIWWQVRSAKASAPQEVDELFMEHLPTLQDADTFVTALCKIVAIDQELFAGRYSTAFSDEFKKRGLPGLEICEKGYRK